MKITIIYVVKELEGPASYIEALCEQHGFNLEIREFNSKVFYDDRDCITSLPAYHVYVNNRYQDTVYPSFDIAEKIEHVIAETARMNKRCFRQKRILKTDSI